MLVHKGTMGALYLYWTGRERREPDGSAQPIMQEYGKDELAQMEDPSQWWELPGRSTLGKKILRHYPEITAVVGEDGTLVDVTIHREDGEKEKTENRVK